MFTTQLSLCTVPPAVRQLVAAQVSLHCYGQPNSGKGRLYVNCGALKEQCGIMKENDFYTKENNKNVEMNTHWSPYMPDQTDRTFFFKEYYCSKETWKCESKFAFAGRAQCQDYKFTTWAAAVTQKMTKNSRQLVILYTEM